MGLNWGQFPTPKPPPPETYGNGDIFWLVQLKGCYWHRVGTDQGFWSTSYNTQNLSPNTITLPQMPIVLRLGNPDIKRFNDDRVYFMLKFWTTTQ